MPWVTLGLHRVLTVAKVVVVKILDLPTLPRNPYLLKFPW